MLITGANAPTRGVKSVFTTFETCKAELERDALRMRAVRLAKKEAKAKERAEKAAAKKARR